jgi:pentatricopeptide repeat protein
MLMQFIDYQNIKLNTSLLDHVALSVLTGLGYYILNRLNKKNENEKVNKKNVKENLIESISKLENSKSLNLFRNYISLDLELEKELRHEEPTIETYNIIFSNILNDVKINLRIKEKKERKIDELLCLFSELKERKLAPNNFTYHKIIEAFLEKNDFESAWKLFEEMEVAINCLEIENFFDLNMMINLIKILKNAKTLISESRDFSDAEKREMKKIEKIEKILSDFILTNKNYEEFSINILLESLISLNKIPLAEKIFKAAENLKLNEKNVTLNIYTYSIMMKAYGFNKDFEKANEIMQKVKSAGLKLNDVIYGCFLNCAVRCNKFEFIKNIWEEMKNNSIEPNCIIYTTLIKAYNKMKLYDTALEIFEKISHEDKINSNIVVYNALLDVCVESKNLEKLKEIYEFIKVMCVQSPGNFPKPNLITYSTIIKGFAKCQRMEEAMEIYDCLKSQNFQLDEVLFNTLIDGYGKAGNSTMAIKLYQEMQNYGIKGSAVIYSILIKMYCNLNNLESALKYFNLYKSEKHKPTIVPYSTLIQVYIRRKELDKAIEIFEEIKNVGLTPDQVSYNFIINGCSFNKKLEKAIDYLHESFARKVKLLDDTYNNLLEYLVNNKFMKTKERIKNISEIVQILKERKFEIKYDLYSRLMKIVYTTNENKINGNKKYFRN